MAQVIEDRVREITTSTGTSNIVLGGAMTGFRSFASVCSIGDTIYAAIVAVDANNSPTGQWEVGNYTYSGANTLSRTTILSSSNSNLVVNFAAGTKHVYIDLPAYQIKQFTTAGQTNPAPTNVWPYGRDANLYTSITFQDEFTGNSLDTTKWFDTIWYERGVSYPKNYSVENGGLHIWPLVDPSRSANGNNGFFNRAFATDGKFSQQYGYFEASIKMPRGKGLFPAFWIFNHQRSEGTIHTEIDIMECYTSADVNALPGWSTTDFRPTDYVGTVWNNQVTQDRAGFYRMVEHAGFPLKDLNAGFNTFGCHWDSAGVRFYFNGQPMGSLITVNSSYFSVRPMYIILDLWLNGQSGIPNATETPQGISNSMIFDYVRAWGIKNP